MTGGRLAVLGYHKVGEPASGARATRHYVSQAAFHLQLGQLLAAGWSFVDADSVVAALAGEGKLPDRAALVTLDGGYLSLLDWALPVLTEYRCPAVVFVATDHVGAFNGFDYSPTREPPEQLCGWGELERLEAAGVSVQSLGASHRPFSRLSLGELTSEVVRSKAELERRLKRPVRFLAYPYGDLGSDTDLMADVLAEAGYEAAFTYGGGPFDPWQADRFRLDRIAVGPGTSFANL